MALQGTLKDFGIADILQLIGQQQKTGYLHLKSGEKRVRIDFIDGSIVKADPNPRKSQELIGQRLARAGLITAAQLEAALQTQQRTLQRLGDVLIDGGLLSRDDFRQMIALQTTEALHQLFAWKSGSYAFEQVEVERDPDVTPMRAESVLMEGFRQVDEWPMVRRRVPATGMSFVQSKALPDVDKKIEPNDRKIYALVEAGRPVARLIELSRLGEFETCKSLSKLAEGGYVLPVDEPVNLETTAGSRPTGPEVVAPRSLAGGVVAGLVLVVMGGVVFRLAPNALELSEAAGLSARDPAVERFVGAHQAARLRHALEVYRLETGALPATLDALAQERLIADDDLRYPWREPYHYRAVDGGQVESLGYVLLPPLR